MTWLLAELDKACLVFIIAKIKLIDFARDFTFFVDVEPTFIS